MKLKKAGVIESVMRNHTLVIIIAVTFMIIGIVALMVMPRNEFPKFTIRQGVIVGVYPGATSAEVEAQLTRTVENYIFGYEEVKKAKTYSLSQDGMMYIFVELNDDVTDADRFWSKLKHGLSELKMTLPPGIMALFADADFGDTSALLVTLSSDSKSYKELEEQLKKLESECRKIPSASKIRHYGLQKEKIYVKVKPELLNEYNIKSLSLLSSYRSNGDIGYAGVLKDAKSDLAIHLPANYNSENDLANQIVYSDLNGNVVRLKNIASIERRYADPDDYIKQNGKKTILLSLEMQPGNNIVKFGKDVDIALANFRKSCPEDIKVAKISELPKYVDDSVKDFMKEFLIAIAAVILVTIILLPLRVASVAGITVPVSVLLTLCFLYFFGIELHTVSLASLILVLGMIVDNSIVVIDNHVEKIDQGYSSWNAAIKSAKELFSPILYATLAIMAAYIPLGFLIPGIPGEFMRSIPIVVSVSLIVSVLVAMFLVPYLNYVFIKKGLKASGEKKTEPLFNRIVNALNTFSEKVFKHPFVFTLSGLVVAILTLYFFFRINHLLIGVLLGIFIAAIVLIVPYFYALSIRKVFFTGKVKKKRSFLDLLQKWFDRSLEKAFRYPKLVVAAGIVLVGLSLILFKNTDQQLFPEMERNQFAVEVYLPDGSSLESTSKVVDSLEKVLLKDKRVTNVTSFIGSSSPRFHTAYTPNMPAHNYGQLLVNTISNEATREVVAEQDSKYSEYFENAHVRYKILSLQDYKAPIEIRISSDSVKDIMKVEAQVNEILKKTEGIAWRRDDWGQKRQYIKVKLNGDNAERQGYSKDLVSASLMIGLDGLPLTTIWEKDYPVEVSLSKESNNPKDLNSVKDLYVTSLSTFSSVPLRSVASFSPDWAEGTIVHRNGVPTLTVQVDNEQNINASGIFDKIEPQIDKLQLPEGTSITYGGESEGQDETFIPMAIALLISILAIFFILLFQFKKVKLVLLILSTMVLAFPGAAIGLKLMNYPFSVTAFIGITSLCGIVVRNGIILIDYARELIEKEGATVYEAALAAGKRRMRPIFLTSAAAAVGVIPMILSRSSLWGPLGTVICFGLIIAMVLTLFILPVLFAYVFKAKQRKVILPKKALIVVIIALCSFAETEAQTLSLDSCKQLALNNNRKIKEAEIEIKAAEEEHKNAFTNYFPKISATGIFMKSSDYLIKGKTPEMNLPVYDGNMQNLSGSTQYAYFPSIPIKLINYFSSVSIDATLPLYTGGRILNGNKLASLGEEVQRSQKTLTTIDILVRTEELFWSLTSLKEKEKTLQAYQVMLDTLYRDVDSYHRAGIVERNDLLKVQLKQNEMQINRLRLQNGIDITTKALCQHIGVPYDTTVQFKTSSLISEFLPVSKESQELATNRQEYFLLNKAVEAEELQQKITYGEYLPQLAITGSGSLTGMMGESSKNAMALVTLNIPISDWWGGSHKIKQQHLKVEKAKLELKENTEMLRLQIAQASNDIKETWFQIQVADKSVVQAKENLRMTEDNYRARTVNITDLLEAQAMFQTTKDNLTDAQCNYQIKLAKYLQATGQYK
jgi:multidrug efflux pump subunit AcrB/outer membrane protein TolC